MTAKKQYKNVYTILEKVKKGEIQGHYKEKDGLFGKLNFYKKPDLIKPHLHYIDETKLHSIVKTQIDQATLIKKEFENFAKTADYAKIDTSKKPDYNSFLQKLKDNYNKIPPHLENDIFKLYYNKMEKLEFETRDSKNHGKFRFLEKGNNPVGKIMAEGSNLKSSIFTRNMMMYYLMQMTIMDYVDPDASDKIKDGLSGEGDSNDGATDDAISKMFDKNTSKNMLDRLLDDAQNTCKMADDYLDEDVQQQMFDEANKTSGGQNAGKLSEDYMRQIAARLESIKLSTGSLKEKLKRLLDKSASYFSSRKITKYEDLFNADSVAGLDDFELLHPKLRKIHLEDIMIKDTKNVGKIDVYIDVSGSMTSGCGVRNDQGNSISKIDFCKSLTAKLKEMDMLNDVYLFDTRLKKIKSDLISISMIDAGGGTTIDVAVQSIVKNGINAIVITDAEDQCNIYSEKAFFIGVEGANFRSFNDDVIRQYSEKAQAIVFNGANIFNVDRNGNVIKK